MNQQSSISTSSVSTSSVCTSSVSYSRATWYLDDQHIRNSHSDQKISFHELSRLTYLLQYLEYKNNIDMDDFTKFKEDMDKLDQM